MLQSNGARSPGRVVWACEHFHVYIFGAPVTVVTDHKPLLGLYGKASSRTSARLERWCLRLIPYDMTLTYEPGHRNPADYMSRHPNNVHDTDCRATKVAEDYIQLITNYAQDGTIRHSTRRYHQAVYHQL